MWDGTEVRECNDLQVRTHWSEVDHYHRVVELELTADGQLWKARGNVLSSSLCAIVARMRRRTPWLPASRRPHLLDARGRHVGYGMSEYLDQLVDGAPVGVSE